MNIFSLVLGVAAVAIFAVDYSRTRSRIALGLALFAAAFVTQLLITTTDPITIDL